MDPYSVLGVAPDAPADEVAAGYRRLAKRWHPDVAGADGERRMAEINSAYDLLRSKAWQERKKAPSPPRPEPAAVARKPAGDWLEPATRRALGPELVSALSRGEEVVLVTPVSVWASPQALLAVTDRRLLWLLDDAVTGRVRTIDLAAITGIETRLQWPRRRSATVRISRRNGRRPLSFSDLRPETAQAIASLVREKVPSR
jgi:hypothetical protein